MWFIDKLHLGMASVSRTTSLTMMVTLLSTPASILKGVFTSFVPHLLAGSRISLGLLKTGIVIFGNERSAMVVLLAHGMHIVIIVMEASTQYLSELALAIFTFITLDVTPVEVHGSIMSTFVQVNTRL